ncbi:SWF or SNF family helicase [Streptomyces sp. HNM0574]|uniref:SWIM zinc finger family protein n=1 Tax=Streptomyces sp. HNM0574 TaxID=2714954 RepID=UPI0032168DA0
MPPARGRGFARTWWGRQWVDALEDSALDSQQLRKGRSQARRGAVGAVSVRPGRITAMVRDGDGTDNRADVTLQELDAAAWHRLLETAAGEAGHIAALLDRDMPPRLVEDAADAGVELLPGIGDLDAECTCGAWDHCVHTAALCYQTARILDEDPCVLLLLRGRTERSVLDELQTRSAARATAPDGTDIDGASRGDAEESEADSLLPAAPDSPDEASGVPAEEAFFLGAVLPPLPPPPTPVETPGTAPTLGSGGPRGSELDAGALEFVVADTAARARRMLREALSPGHADSAPGTPLTENQDAVRMAATHSATPDAVRRLASARNTADSGPAGTDRGRTEHADAALQRAVAAWKFGGAAALAVLEDTWNPDADELARAQAQLESAWEHEGARPPLRAEANRWTDAGKDSQLRLGRDGRWWPFRREHGAWWPAGGAERDPAAALAVARSGAE